MSRVKKTAYCGALICLALILSYIESLFSLSYFIPVPGIKIGISNLAVMVAFYAISPGIAVVVSLGKVCLSALLFGTPISFMFSLFGAVFAFLALLLHRYLIKGRISLIGASIMSAAFHLLGQGIFGLILLGDMSVFYYISVILPFSVVTGSIIGYLAGVICKAVLKGARDG